MLYYKKIPKFGNLLHLLHPAIGCRKGGVLPVGEAPVVEVPGGPQARLVVSRLSWRLQHGEDIALTAPPGIVQDKAPSQESTIVK